MPNRECAGKAMKDVLATVMPAMPPDVVACVTSEVWRGCGSGYKSPRVLCKRLLEAAGELCDVKCEWGSEVAWSPD